LGASLKVVKNSLSVIWGAIILLALVSFWLFRRRRGAMVAFCREKKGLIVAGELIFGLAFLFFVGLRILNPDLWQPWTGGEKSMEIAFLNAVLRSPYFPPHDPYFAGGYVNYYYYGYFIVALLIKLTGVLPQIAFNLAIPTLFALTVVSLFSLGYNLSEGRRWVAGLAAAAFVALVGNLDPVLQILRGLSRAGGVNLGGQVPLLGMVKGIFVGAGQVLFKRADWPSLDYWRSTRVVPYTINEFPYFSFLFADLHPHMMAIPFALFSLALGVNLALGARRERDFRGGGLWNILFRLADFLSLRRLLELGVICLSLGAVAVINTWDFPTYLGLIFLALLIWGYIVGRLRGLVTGAILFIPLPLLSLLLYLPFFTHYEALYVGLGRVREQTKLGAFLTIWGFFLFLSASFLASEALRLGILGRALRLARSATEHRGRFWRWFRLYMRVARSISLVSALAILLLALLYLALSRQWVLLLASPLVLLSCGLLFRRDASPRELLVYALIFTGLLILSGCEVIYLRDFLDGGPYRRMNTLFKFYIQVWVLLGLAMGVGVTHVWRYLREAAWGWPRKVWLVCLSLLLSMVLLYPILGTPARLRDRFSGARPPVGTLDGLAYMTVGSFIWPDGRHRIELKYDYEAIMWLLDNVKGLPVILEAPLSYYRAGALRVASYTGFPTVVGFHQNEQRYGWMVSERELGVRTLYDSPDLEQALELLDRYHVSYIYVGQLERIEYSAEGLAKFEAMRGKYLDLVYENPKVKVYRVRGV